LSASPTNIPSPIGCAKVFREIGAEVAVTYLNEKARPYVEPLATGLDVHRSVN
jgi:enoyl-[acyl-carrier-protein] reductase (NADH)